MLKTISFNPCTLMELSIQSIFGVNCKESISKLEQLSAVEIFDAAKLVKRKRVIFSMYEPVYDPVHKVVDNNVSFPNNWVKFCQDNCKLSSTPAELSALLYLMDKFDLVTYCCKVLLVKDRSKVLSIANGDSIPKSMDVIIFTIRNLLNLSKKLNVKMTLSALSFLQLKHSSSPPLREIFGSHILVRYDKILSCFAMAALFQLKYSFSILGKALGINILKRSCRTRNIVKSVDLLMVRSSLINLLRDVSDLEKTILPVIHVCNFISLEEMVKMFKMKDSLLCKAEINMAYIILRRKYSALIASKKLMIINILEKIKQRNEAKSSDKVILLSSYMYNLSSSMQKLKNEIMVMELFLGNIYEVEFFPEEEHQVKKMKINK
ncbi:hypothetical protein [Candidatus Ichthyocystis hellenicum]|uniref:hypothetical protein n=1 Tax=Candidatus Ichthyocystis hellenicum TaxID=1561003 RepID=UPI000B872B94|nr:hypothetical protein [Candidatus Ichthyocystis hellenicum]